MNRDILFRGKRADGTGWAYGDLIQHEGSCTIGYNFTYTDHQTGISENRYYEAAIIPETVGQYTGYKEKEGKMIFDGDILNPPDSDYTYCVVRWNEKYAAFVIYGYYHPMYFNEGGGEEFASDLSSEEHTMVFGQEEEFDIIGNIHDNPELLNTES